MAWLFDVYPHPRRSALVVWIKHGDRVEKRLVPYQPTFCIKAEADPLEKAEQQMRDDPRVEAVWYDETALWLRGPMHRVLRIQPKRFQEMTRIATDLRRQTKSKGYLFFDVDHQPESRWMHEQGLWSMCRLATESVLTTAHAVSGDGPNSDSAGVGRRENHDSDGVGHDQSDVEGGRPNDVSAAVGHAEQHDRLEGPLGPGGKAAALRETCLHDVQGVGGGTRNHVTDAFDEDVECSMQSNVSAAVGHAEQHDRLEGPLGPGGKAAALRETCLPDVQGVGGGTRNHVTDAFEEDVECSMQSNVSAAVGHGQKHVAIQGPPGPGGKAAALRASGLLDVPGVAGGTRDSVISHASGGVEVQGVAGGTRSPAVGAEGGVCVEKVIWPLRPHPFDERFTIDYPDPFLKTAWLRVTVDKQGHTAAFTDPLVSVQLGGTTWNVTDDPGSERGVLMALGKALRETDPDVLFTKHGDRFDVPYLLHAMRRHGLQETVTLGRERDPDPAHPDQEGKSISTYGRWLYKTSAYYLRGRWHVDLSKKTLDSEDDRKDIHGILYLTRVSNRRAQDINRNGAGYALQQMQIDEAIDMGVALPWKRNLAEDWKDAATLCAVDRGGQIMVPTPGLYEDVAACDFSGYYPSLVVQHNLSSDTINCACCPDGPIVPELNYHVCEKNTGHQSGILKRIAPHRKWAKAVLRKAKHDGLR